VSKRTLTITNTNFTGNTAEYGGAVYADVERVSITGGTFSSNRATQQGGAIFYDSRGQAVRSRLNVTGALFIGNIATWRDGGAIWNGWGIGGKIENSTFLINGAGGVGGALYDPIGNLDIINNTFYWNGAATGGALFVSAEAMGNGVLANTIFYANTADDEGPDVFGEIDSVGHNLIGDDSDSTGWVGTDLVDEDPKLNALGYYGGTTQTMTLQSDSPAKDAGDNTYATSSTDERGETRIVTTVDIGAVEMQSGEYSLSSPYAYDFDFTVAIGDRLTVPAIEDDPTIIDFSGNSGNAEVYVFAVDGLEANVDTEFETTGGGLLTVYADGTFEYEAPTDWVGDDEVAYTMSDGETEHSGTITFHVTNTQAFDGDFWTLKNQSLTVDDDPSGLLHLGYAASGDGLTVTKVNGLSGNLETPLSLDHGTLTVQTDGSFVFVPTTGFTGEQTFEFTVGDGLSESTATATIHVVKVLASDGGASTLHDVGGDAPGGLWASGLLSLASDADGDPDDLTITAIDGDPDAIGFEVGTVMGGLITVESDGSFVYEPPPHWAGDDWFAFTVADENDNESTAFFVIQVSNTPPVVTDAEYSTDMNDPFIAPGIDFASGLLINASDDDEDDLVIYAIQGLHSNVGNATQTDQGGTVTVEEDGSWVYTPPLNWTGDDTFTFTVWDGCDFITAIVTIHVG
jgi:predicted outer membrane repeat protein